ncbi:hypothetical protein CHARACLAT_018897 [Characodon lateralis]|uniref:Uncharacterized protein n=1 Tax=Characodon lateralis TaxID=208331 RepID=A0ABU7DAT1_9TELE|nr:hypothetical protein [Characodon lateralis]
MRLCNDGCSSAFFTFQKSFGQFFDFSEFDPVKCRMLFLFKGDRDRSEKYGTVPVKSGHVITLIRTQIKSALIYICPMQKSIDRTPVSINLPFFTHSLSYKIVFFITKKVNVHS